VSEDLSTFDGLDAAKIVLRRSTDGDDQAEEAEV
jgi:hypothetical protein